MDNSDVAKEYALYQKDFSNLQLEAEVVINEIIKQHSTIDIADIKQRPANAIKSLKSILSNLQHPEKYKNYTSIFQIKDIAGLRITCCCEDDMDALGIVLVGELKQRGYSNVTREDKGGNNNTGKSRPPYRAVHITFTKEIKVDDKLISLSCEIQIRTVMANAWAALDRKYVYGKAVEGDVHVLTDSIAGIMKSCEGLWSLIKKSSLKTDGKDLSDEIKRLNSESQQYYASVFRLTKPEITSTWFSEHKSESANGLKKLDINTFMEVMSEIPNTNFNIDKKMLLNTARNSTIRTFGWPIGVFLDNKREYMPKPDSNGIHAEVSINEKDWVTNKDRKTYDYWAINSNGAFYLSKSLFEGVRKPTHIFFNTRIVRITEVLQYLYKLYTQFGVPPFTTIKLTIRHSGLKDKILGAAGPERELFSDYKTTTPEVSTTIDTTLEEINRDMVGVVEKFTKELFEQFDFFTLERDVLENIVFNYIKGKVT
jgi:ppGpp synthetase/RelA/SpoT-type nucleotidyltranferase